MSSRSAKFIGVSEPRLGANLIQKVDTASAKEGKLKDDFVNQLLALSNAE
jgi:hypothetical protein